MFKVIETLSLSAQDSIRVKLKTGVPVKLSCHIAKKKKDIYYAPQDVVQMNRL